MLRCRLRFGLRWAVTIAVEDGTIEMKRTMRTAEMNEADAHGEDEANDCAPGRSGYAHVEVLDEDKVQNKVEGGAGHYRYHYQAGVAVCFNKALQGEAHNGWDGAEGHDMHEADCQMVEAGAAGADEGYNLRGEGEEDDGEDDAANQRCQDGQSEDAVGFFCISAA